MKSLDIPHQKALEVWERLDSFVPSLPVVVSYFTDLFYLREAFELVRSCQLHDLDYRVEQVPNLKTWARNTSHKPEFLIKQHRIFKDRAILWLDADARVRQYPDLFDTDRKLVQEHAAPISYHTWKGKTPCSGTVYLPPGKTRYLILAAWAEECLNHPTLSDQLCMEMAVRSLEIKHCELPEEYCWIYDLAGKTVVPSPLLKLPVIEQMQASRWVAR